MPDGATPPIWGFVRSRSAGSCTDAGVDAQIPGPVLDVSEGDSVT